MNKQLPKIIISSFGLGFIVLLILLLTLFLIGAPELKTEQNTTLYSAENEIIGVSSGVENREWIPLEEISEHLIDATIIIEDKHFYSHFGFDIKRIAIAIWRNINSLSLGEGASTITQQLARNLYLTHEKTLTRKGKEALYALRLEMHYSKDEILEAYLNTIYYGHGAYGVQAASRYFFNKDQTDLSHAEAAMLTGIPKGPTYYSPFSNLTNAEARKELILSRLYNEKKLTDADYQLATEEVLHYATNEARNNYKRAAHFQDIVITEAAEILNLSNEAVSSSGLNIYTTLDYDLQIAVEQALKQTIPAATELEAAVLSIEPHNGAVLALAGGRDYKVSMFNRAINAKRMPGSSFKPFLYYAALQHSYTPLTKIESKPTAFSLENGEVYQPSNFKDYYAYEPITLAQAIALSDNVYAVRTLFALGVDTFPETLRQFGFTSNLPAVPSLALGTAAVSLKEMVIGYSMLANGGKETSSYTIEKIADWQGNTIYKRQENPKKEVLDEQTSFILTHLLTGMFNSHLNGYLPVTGTSITNELSRVYAGKSGTTQADHWMVGYSPSVVTGVWTGYDDHRHIGHNEEAAYAKQIWAEVMEQAHEGMPQEQFPTPKGLVGIPIDVDSGLRATPNCSKKNVLMYFKQGTEPDDYCEHGIPDPNDKKGGIFKKWFQLFF